MANLADRKTVGEGFRNAAELVRVTYDFDADGGSIADYTVLTADSDCVVEFSHADVKTAVTSGGSLVADLGKGAGGTQFWSNKAVADLTLDAILGPGAAESNKVELASGETIQLGLEAAAATAGKVEFVFKVYAR